MRVWVLGRGYPTEKNNMLGSFEFEQAQMLAKHGFEVFYPVVNIVSLRRAHRFSHAEQCVGGVSVITLNAPLGVSVLWKKAGTLKKKCLRYLFRRMVRRYGRPDILHVHYPSIYPDWLFADLRARGVRIVGTEHWSKVQNKQLSVTAVENLKNCVLHYDALFCVGEQLKKSITELTGTQREITVLPNIVSKDFSYAPDEKKDNVFRFIGIGRLVPDKRFDLLIRAFNEAFAGEKSVRLDIVGGGPEQKNLEELIETLGCGDQVSLLGVKNRTEVAAFYHQCSALAVSSKFETFGVPIIEAMASGLPVVTTDAMGFPHLFHKEQGEIVPVDDCAAFSAAMRYVYEHYDMYDRAAIAAYAEAHFSEDVIFAQLKLIYEDTMNKNI